MTGVILSLVQLVAAVSVAHHPCPAYKPVHGLSWSCYEPSTRTVYLARQDWRDRFALLHEYGHAYDFERMTDAEREQVKRILGYSQGRPWWLDRPGTNAPAETFADAYADCALGNRWRIRRLCSMLPPSAYAVLIRRPRT